MVDCFPEFILFPSLHLPFIIQVLSEIQTAFRNLIDEINFPKNSEKNAYADNYSINELKRFRQYSVSKNAGKSCVTVRSELIRSLHAKYQQRHDHHVGSLL